MNLSEPQADLRHFAAERDWQPFQTPKNLSTALMVESAELAEIFQWMTPEQSGMAHQDAGLKQSTSDEVAVLLLYLLQVADHCEINVEQAVRDKLARKGLKYPVKRRNQVNGTHGIGATCRPPGTDAPESENSCLNLLRNAYGHTYLA